MAFSCKKSKHTFPTAALSTSGIRVEGDSFLSACYHKLPCILSCKIKTGGVSDASCKKSLYHDFLRRHYPHQVKGSKFGYFLSACFTSSPVFIYIMLLYTHFRKMQGGWKNIGANNRTDQAFPAPKLARM